MILMGESGKRSKQGEVMLQSPKIMSASGRAWFDFAMNSKVLTDRQRDRIFASLKVEILH